MTKWLAKRLETLATWDDDGNKLTDYSFNGYELRQKTSSNQKPNASYDIIEGVNISREYAKIQKNGDGEWEVVEDATKKDIVEAKRQERIATKSRLLNIDWNDMTAAKQRNLLKDLVTYMVK